MSTIAEFDAEYRDAELAVAFADKRIAELEAEHAEIGAELAANRVALPAENPEHARVLNGELLGLDNPQYNARQSRAEHSQRVDRTLKVLRRARDEASQQMELRRQTATERRLRERDAAKVLRDFADSIASFQRAHDDMHAVVSGGLGVGFGHAHGLKVSHMQFAQLQALAAFARRMASPA